MFHITGPLWGESIGHRWFPLTEGQWCGKHFHIMTSSWTTLVGLYLSWEGYARLRDSISVGLYSNFDTLQWFPQLCYGESMLIHWGGMTRICVGKLTTIDSDNGLSPVRRQTTIWTNAGILLIGLPGTNYSEILIKIQTFSLKKISFKMSSAKCCPCEMLSFSSRPQCIIKTCNYVEVW